MIDEAHWRALRSMEAADVCRRALCRYCDAAGAYELSLLNRTLVISPAEAMVRWGCGAATDDRAPGYNEALVGVTYLLGASECPLEGEWVGAESLPAGPFFFRGPHTLPTDKIAATFGCHGQFGVGALAHAATALGGTVLARTAGNVSGEMAVQLQVLPRIPVRCLLWRADDEFPARATMLFDRSIGRHLLPDGIYCLAHVVAKALCQAGGEAFAKESAAIPGSMRRRPSGDGREAG